MKPVFLANMLAFIASTKMNAYIYLQSNLLEDSLIGKAMVVVIVLILTKAIVKI